MACSTENCTLFLLLSHTIYFVKEQSAGKNCSIAYRCTVGIVVCSNISNLALQSANVAFTFSAFTFVSLKASQ